MEKNPDIYFAKTSPVQCFGFAEIVFRSKDALAKTLYECIVPGHLVMNWLPKGYLIDLTTKFRRNKFGGYLVQKLSMRFLPHGELELYANGLQDLLKSDNAIAENAKEVFLIQEANSLEKEERQQTENNHESIQ